MDWTNEQIMDFVVKSSGERRESSPEGPAVLGDYTVWRCWTYDGQEYHAHYVIAEEGKDTLLFKRDFQPFANWLMRAFSATDAHDRNLAWFRSGIAAVIILTLLWLVVWAVLDRQATGVDFRWLVAALATTSLGYLLGGVPRFRAPASPVRP